MRAKQARRTEVGEFLNLMLATRIRREWTDEDYDCDVLAVRLRTIMPALAVPLPKRKDIKWVTTDCYGTLIDWEKGISRRVQEGGRSRTA